MFSTPFLFDNILKFIRLTRNQEHMSIVIKKVTDKSDLKKFVYFNINLYKGCDQYVPPLIYDEFATLNRDKNTHLKQNIIWLIKWRDCRSYCSHQITRE